ncbi:hypothetical protein ES703_60625 [subsurface metagenome]
MRRKAYFLTLIILTALVFVFTAGCCSILESIKDERLYKEGEQIDINGKPGNDKDIGSEKPENTLPIVVMEIYQQSSSGNYFKVGNPVYFSAVGSADADGDDLSFQWQIRGIEISFIWELTGKEISYIFDSAGEYEITLMVYDGTDTVEILKKIYLAELNGNILITKAHEMTVGIEYIITNNGPGDIKDLICLFEIPQTYQPFQIIKNRKSNYSETDEIYSGDYNLIAKFSLGNLSEGESANAYINCDAVLYEYGYADIGNGPGSYDLEDKDLSLYTSGEYYINSDSQIIKSSVESIVGEEKTPRIIAEKLYNFVADRMVYDKEKLGKKTTGYSYASDILQQGRGVCSDYSTLYAALCRAAGIPAKFVQGMPVFSILTEGGGQLPYTHAWVEIKLPGYGWIPIDITAESGFMSYNYYLNMETYKGSGVFYESLSVDGENFYPNGFYYSWEGNTEPDVTREAIYSVSGLDLEEISVISEKEFLEKVNYILSEYEAAKNHVNMVHPESWIFNDPQEIAVEETFLTRLIEISQELESISYPGSYAADRNNLVAISREINLHKEEQIKCMKNGNYDCYKDQYDMFIDSVNELFDYYNNMVLRFKQKY